MPVELLESELTPDEQTTAAVADEYQPGELAPSIVTDQKVWKPADIEDVDKTLIETLKTLVNNCSTTDEAARRFSVLQTWETRHMDRGYQYLDSDQGNGAWQIVGSGKKNPLQEGDDANLYPTNILSAQGDIVTGSLCRGAIKTTFAPRKSKNPSDAMAADEANKYRYIWEKSNPDLQNDLMGLGWTDCRVLTWTRSMVDKGRWGTIPGSEDLMVVQVSSPHGVLETKLPMMVDKLPQCGYAQIWEEQDYAVARAAYPWMGNKIKPSWGTFGELEFERIARINTRIGITGKYVTGTSGLRETTMGYIWFRPGLYFDDAVQIKQREFMLQNFPDGVFIIMAGQEFVCCWNENMDSALELGMYTRGFGQNRRSLGSSDVPIQKRINIWADLWDKIIRKSQPGAALHDEAFNVEAIAQLESDPGRLVSAVPPEGMTLDQCVMPFPVSQPIQGMMEAFQFYVGPLMQSIDGGTPALFGGGEGQDNTVGATQIRLNQSLERYGPVWVMANKVYARCATQAAKNCAKNGNDEYTDTVQGVGDINVKKANLQGDFECMAETVNAIPESGAQREAKVIAILEMAQRNPEIAALVGKPGNAREIVRGMHLEDVISIAEANSEDGALEDIERLLESEPNINPVWAQLNNQMEALHGEHEAAKNAAMMAAAEGMQIDPETLAAGDQMAQKLEALAKQVQQTPKYQPSIAVPDDESMDYETIADTVFDWMQESDGRQLRRAAAMESEGGPNWKKWTNVFLYWQGNKAQAAKLAAQNVAPVQPKMTITVPVDKMAASASPTQAKLLAAAGIQVAATQPGAPHEVEETQRVYTPQAEVATTTKRRL